MKRFFRVLLTLALLAGIGGAIAYFTVIVKQPLVLTGIVTTDDVIVSAQIQGRIDKLLVDQGDTVKRGQLLAVIDPAQFQADMSYYQHAELQAATQVSEAKANERYEVSQTSNQILQAQANFESAKAQVTQAESDLENTRLTFERESQMYKMGAETQVAYDLARTSYDAQKARLISLKKQVASAQAAVGLAESNAEQVAARRETVAMDEHALNATSAQKQKAAVQLGYTEIRAPINGVVDARPSLQGEVINPAQAIVTLINPDDLWVRADVEETYIDRIHLGDKIPVRLPSGTEREGVVFYRGIDADYATQRDVSRTKRDIKTFEIRLRCDNKDRSLAMGMTAYVLLPMSE